MELTQKQPYRKNNFKKTNPGLKFFLMDEDGDLIEELPDEVHGLHLLANHVLNLFVQNHGFEPTRLGKYQFAQQVLSADVNKCYTQEDALFRLSRGIALSFDVRSKHMDHRLNSKDRRHLEYGIMKDLEHAMKEHS
jgi:hypothetical protein